MPAQNWQFDSAKRIADTSVARLWLEDMCFARATPVPCRSSCSTSRPGHPSNSYVRHGGWAVSATPFTTASTGGCLGRRLHGNERRLPRGTRPIGFGKLNDSVPEPSKVRASPCFSNHPSTSSKHLRYHQRSSSCCKRQTFSGKETGLPASDLKI